MIYFALTIFVSAFLVFQVQPMIGKYILPWFGSSTGVWTSALLFFQLVLLLGYGYAHFLSTRFPRRAQVFVHVLLLAVVLLLLPITPAEQWKPEAQENPIWHILLLLGASVGGPYLLLSASAPLLQHWFAQVYPERSPFRLYALSNIGSLLALLSYPFVFEYLLPLRVQVWGWSAAWGVFAVLSVLCGWQLWKCGLKDAKAVTEASSSPDPDAGQQGGLDTGTAERPGLLRIAWWLMLSAAGSVVLLATLNQMTLDLPPVPFLFVLPLSLYLLTFIIAFASERWYRRSLWIPLLLLSLAGICITIYMDIEFGLLRRSLIYLAVLFTCCLCCHGGVVRLKPAPKHLTLFYLMIALGGALGGAFVAVVAPAMFNGYWEYEIGLMAAFALVLLTIVHELLVRSPEIRWPDARHGLAESGGLEKTRLGSWIWARRLLAGALLAVTAAGLLAMAKVLEEKIAEGRNAVIAQSRSFYGTLRVTETGTRDGLSHAYLLWHGQIKHGRQFRAKPRRTWATTYYGQDSGVGIAIDAHPHRLSGNRPLRLGGVGLGVGTLAAYVNQAYDANHPLRLPDSICFYEINPDIVTYAETHFSFLQDARDRGAEVEVLLGDARIVLEQQLKQGKAQAFDVLAVDAFSGDVIPMHLLTKECFDLYWSHLKPDGILAVHISNKYLDLLPVVTGAAQLHGAEVCLIKHDGIVRHASAQAEAVSASHRYEESWWALVTHNAAFLASDQVQQAQHREVQDRPALLWTDDFSSLLGVLN